MTLGSLSKLPAPPAGQKGLSLDQVKQAQTPGTIAKAAQGVVNYGKNVFNDYAKAGQDIVTDVKSGIAKGQNTRTDGGNNGNVIGGGLEAGLNVAGDVAGAAFAPITELPPVKALIGKIATIPGVQWTAEKLNAWAQTHPEAAKDLGSVANIATLGVGGPASKAVKDVAAKTAQGAADVAEKTAGSLEGAAKSQLSKEALDIVAPKLNAAEKASAIAQGRLTTTGILKKATIAPSKYDKQVADSVTGTVRKGLNDSTKISSINAKISSVADQVQKGVANTPGTFNDSELGKFLDKAKDESKVIFGTDKTLENSYDAIKSQFMDLVHKYGNTLSGVLQARKDFDKLMEQKFPNVFTKDVGDNVRRNAIMDVRMAGNDFIASKLPEGSQFKDMLRQQSLMYEAKDRIAAKAIANVDTNALSRVVNIVKSHPVISLEVAGGVGFFGDKLAPILENPLAVSAIIAYGSYKIGKKIITSVMLKNALSKMLRVGAKTLSGEDKNAIQSLLDKFGSPSISGAASSLEDSASPSVANNVITSTANRLMEYETLIKSGDATAESVYSDVASKVFKPGIAQQIVDDATNNLTRLGQSNLAQELKSMVDVDNLTPQGITSAISKLLKK